MILPRGQAVHEDLNASFVQFDAMLDELKSNHLTGYLRVAAWKYEGILVFDTGNVVNAVDESDGVRRWGDAAAQAIAAKARGKDGTISVYRLSEELTQLLAGFANGEPMLTGAAGDAAAIRKLISRLDAQKLTGYVEFKLKGNAEAATFFLREGKLVESIWGNNENLLAGKEGLDAVLLAAGQPGASFAAYRVNLAQAYGRRVVLVDEPASQPTLDLWAQILSTVNATVDRHFKPGFFLTAFKRACIEQAQAYPFLDPFAAEFEFKQGRVSFAGKTGAAEFNRGLSQCLKLTIEKLAGEPKGADLVPKLTIALAELRTTHGAQLQELQLASTLPSMFGV